jgi:hypothetical protein
MIPTVRPVLENLWRGLAGDAPLDQLAARSR